MVGNGRTDRVIDCSTPSITARYRIFDRSGDQPGIIIETLSTSTEEERGHRQHRAEPAVPA